MKKTSTFAVLALCCGLSWGQMACQKKVASADPTHRQMSSAGVLGAPRPTAAGPGSLQLHLPGVQEVQVMWRSGSRETLVRMHREGKRWWAVHQKNPGEAWGYPMQSPSIDQILRSLQGLKPSSLSEFAPDHAQIQLSLFAKNKRFLMRVLQAPFDKGPTAIHKGEWLVYHRGTLYEQKLRGPLGRSVPPLLALLKRTIASRNGVLLPLHSAGMDFRQARLLAKQLHKQRLSLRRCFKKRRFPQSVGPLRMQLLFGADGKVQKRRILTRAHTKFKVVWCVWWFAKKFKVPPLPIASLKYNLVVPPGGP